MYLSCVFKSQSCCVAFDCSLSADAVILDGLKILYFLYYNFYTPLFSIMYLPCHFAIESL